MCNISGYVGTKPAAPILLEMMRKQEGLDCGFYTGISTIHEGKIYCTKVVGDVDTLINTTNAASLPGTIGFIHGRTPGGALEGIAEWSHPFTTETDGEIRSSFVENGCVRFFKPLRPKFVEIAEQLKKDGYPFKTEIYAPESSFKLSNGCKLHYCDILCQLITQKIDQGADSVTAIADACCQMPTETVGLYLTTTEPDSITWVRQNFPMHVSFVSHGAYLATAPMAFPEDAGEPQLLPHFSSGLIKKDSLLIKPFKKAPATISPLDSITYHKLYEVIYEELHKDGGTTVPKIGTIIISMFEPADLQPVGAALYRILYDIDRNEKIKITEERIPGKLEGLTAPVFHLSL